MGKVKVKDRGEEAAESSSDIPTISYRVIRKGVSSSRVASVARMFKLPNDRFTRCIGLSPATINRRNRKGEKLDHDQTERVLHAEKVFKMATAVLGSKEDAIQWLNQPNRTLNNDKPIDVLDTVTGANEVIDILGAIEHSIYL